MRSLRSLVGFVLLCLILPGLFPLVRAADWPPISREELAMTDDPANPGASAMLLYREVGTDDVKRSGTEYRRIKVLNDDGKKYGDIEIPYLPDAFQIEGIQARTIRPDGTTVDFQGQIFDRTVLRRGKIKIQVKALTLPEVQKGGINRILLCDSVSAQDAQRFAKPCRLHHLQNDRSPIGNVVCAGRSFYQARPLSCEAIARS